MLPSSLKAPWQQQLIDSVTDLDELLGLLQLKNSDADQKSCSSFPLRVPRDYITRMQIANPRDPLLLQVLPVSEELHPSSGYSLDPLGEAEATKVPGLLHKYQGRVLLILTGACAINCRYCFRRHFPYQENRLSPNHLQNILDYLLADTSISEVILSGGDPLVLKDEVLQNVIQQLSQVPHLKYLRIHTRLPIMIPARITDTLLLALSENRLKPALVMHCNHPNELSESVRNAMTKFQSYPIQLLNQAVLLKGVNDSSETLSQLSHALYSCGILPYYLHALDPIQGAAHFAVPEADAIKLVKQLHEELPGYLVPRFVKEIAGAKHKIPINDC